MTTTHRPTARELGIDLGAGIAPIVAPADYLRTPAVRLGREDVYVVEYVAVTFRPTGTPPVHLEPAYRHAGIVDGVLVGRGESLCGKDTSRMHEVKAVGREVSCAACLAQLDDRARNVAEDVARADAEARDERDVMAAQADAVAVGFIEAELAAADEAPLSLRMVARPRAGEQLAHFAITGRGSFSTVTLCEVSTAKMSGVEGIAVCAACVTAAMEFQLLTAPADPAGPWTVVEDDTDEADGRWWRLMRDGHSTEFTYDTHQAAVAQAATRNAQATAWAAPVVAHGGFRCAECGDPAENYRGRWVHTGASAWGHPVRTTAGVTR